MAAAVSAVAAMPLEQRVREHAARVPMQPAVVTPDCTLTWSELDRAADALAARLVARGLRPGDRIGWLARNRASYPVLVVAARRARLAIVGLNWRLAAEELAYIIRHAEPALVFCEEEFRNQVPPAIATATPELPQAAGDSFVALPPQPDDPMMLLYTSGTTGRPKGVVYPLAGLEQVLVAPTPLGLRADSIALIVPPVFHIAGSTWSQYALVFGATQVLFPAAAPAAILEAIERWRVTHAVWVPTIVQMALDEQRQRPRDLGSLQTLGYGAAPMPTELLRQALQTFRCRFVQAYGTTESLSTVCHLPPEAHTPDGDRSDTPPATGYPDPGVMLRIVDTQTGKPLGPNQPGEVHVRLPWMRPRYWNLPAGVRSSFDAEDWLHTGDVGLIDERGCLRLVDRLGDLIITGGENVYPTEVENVLLTLPGVADVAVLGVDDPRWGQRVCAVLVAAPGSHLDPDMVIAGCRKRLAAYKCPTEIRIASALPRNAAGKVVRRLLREQP